MKNKFLFKLILSVIILYLAQIVFVYFFPLNIPIGVSAINKYKEKGIDIIYFGDSTLTYTSVHDRDLRSTVDILSDFLKTDYSVGTVGSPAWNSDVYFAHAKFMKKINYAPKYVIVPINLRNFSIPSDLYPAYQFTDDFTYLAYYDTPLYPFISLISNLVMADVNNKYDNLYKNSIVYDGNKPQGKAEFFEKMSDDTPYSERLRKMIIFYYMADLNPKHRKLKSLLEIARLFKNTDSKVIFYVTPIDIETGEKYYGRGFKEQINKNIHVISETLKNEDVVFLDLSSSLKSSNFNWHEGIGGQKYLDEHINNYGKKYVARKLAEVIESVK